MKRNRIAAVIAVFCLAGLLAGAEEFPGTRYHSTIYGLEIEKRIARNHLDEDVEVYQDIQKRWRKVTYQLNATRTAIDRLITEDPEEIDSDELQTLERQLKTQRDQFNSLMEEGERVRERISERVRLIASLKENLTQLRDTRRENAGPLTGVWEVEIMPLDESGIFVLSQDGPQVVGEYLLGESDRGSLEGTFVDGQIRLIRRDNRVGNHSVLKASYSYNTDTLNGTWQKFDLSGGVTSGDWVGHKKESDEGGGAY